MALRIADAPAVAVPERPLAERAVAAYKAADANAVAALWAQAREIEDHHERYVAQRTLAEAGVAVRGGSPAETARRFIACARGALRALEDRPNEPLLLNYAGVALYEIGELTGAGALFEAAERLVPGETEAAANLAEIKRRRGASIQVSQALPVALRAELGDLRRRATRIGSAAGPVADMTLSLCMIVRDEEAHLGQCLEAVAGVVDEMVIVDTGSVDRTKEIAASFGARIVDFPWTGDFSEARNVSLEHATGDWILFLDADEVLVADDRDALRALITKSWREAFHLVETNYVGAIEDGLGVTHNTLRVFRNRPHYRFKGRIHEQILESLPRQFVERFEQTQVRIDHYGYLGVVRDAKDKSRRNIELLEQQAADGADDPFHLFNLGSEYMALSEGATAAGYLGKAWDKLTAGPDPSGQPFVPMLIARLAKSRHHAGDLDGALQAIDEGLAMFPGFTDLVFEHGLIAAEQGDRQRARELFELCLEWGDAPTRYVPTLGAGTFLASVQLAQLRRDEGDLDGAEELLRRSLREHPRFVQPVDALAGIMLRRGATAQAVEDEITESLGTLSPGVHFVLGMALYEAGLAEAAEPHFRAVLERQPTNGVGRIALGEALLSQRRWNEAREVVREVADDTLCTGAARGIELFALLVQGESATARVVLADVGEAVDRGDASAFTAWIDICEGRAPTAGPEAAAGLGTALEALLRVQEIDAFAALVGALDGAIPVARDRREVLATMYLRLGYLDSAADEWAAACEIDGPDAAAFVGLAQVALARGEAGDAELFAEAALEVDPTDRRAARFLEGLRARQALTAS